MQRAEPPEEVKSEQLLHILLAATNEYGEGKVSSPFGSSRIVGCLVEIIS